jgi:hypothetical protein
MLSGGDANKRFIGGKESGASLICSTSNILLPDGLCCWEDDVETILNLCVPTAVKTNLI